VDFNLSAALRKISDICVGSKSDNRAAILKYEEYAKELPQIEIPVRHYIHGGMYAREITIPKDTVITGQIYKFDHFDVMISGDITVSTDTGETKRLTGYNLFEGLSGKKRAGYAHEDTTWVTFHPFTGESGDAIQEMITAKDFAELRDFYLDANTKDYELFLQQVNMTEDQIRAQVENKLDRVDMPEGYEHIIKKRSEIEGHGIFSSKKIFKGDFIAPSRIENSRTMVGVYTNHAVFNNAKMIVVDNCIYLAATRDIEPNEEITVNYRQVLTERMITGDLCQE
jgi:hypothetical protein